MKVIVKNVTVVSRLPCSHSYQTTTTENPKRVMHWLLVSGHVFGVFERSGVAVLYLFVLWVVADIEH